MRKRGLPPHYVLGSVVAIFLILVEWKFVHTCLPLDILPVSSYVPGPGFPFSQSLKRRPVLKLEALELLVIEGYQIII